MDAKRLGHKPLSARIFKGLPATTITRLKRRRGRSADQAAMPLHYDDNHEGLKGLIEDLSKGELLGVLKEQLDDNSLRVVAHRALKWPPAALMDDVCHKRDGTSQPRNVLWLIRKTLGLHYEPGQITEAGFERIRILLEQLGFQIDDVEDHSKNRLGKDANPGINGTVILRRLFESPGK